VERSRLVALAAVTAVIVTGATGCGSSGEKTTNHRDQQAVTARAAFRHFNWLSVTLPGSICRGRRPIHLRHGWAVARTTRRSDGGWREWPRIYLSEVGSPVTYGTLGGNSAAALFVGCNNGGGTADGFMAYAQAIFVARGHSAPVLVGIVKPHIRPWGTSQLASLLSVSFQGNDVIAHEAFYGGSDGTCCASGRATTIWQFARGTLTRLRTTITRKPHWL
jgi:hypothetical protein